MPRRVNSRQCGSLQPTVMATFPATPWFSRKSASLTPLQTSIFSSSWAGLRQMVVSLASRWRQLVASLTHQRQRQRQKERQKQRQRKYARMQQLKHALQTTLSNTVAFPRGSGVDGLTKNSVGTNAVSPMNGMTSTTTGPAATPLMAVARQTGPRPGALTVAEMPTGPTELSALAGACLASRLPPLLASWLDAMETEEQRTIPIYPPIQAPERTEALLAPARDELSNLQTILKPAGADRALEKTVYKLFVAFNQFMGDELKTEAQIEVWADQLEGYPIWAIQKAYQWAVTGERKMPSIAEFIADVKLAMGSGLLVRKRILERWVQGRAA
jgi:hypothetical protein